MNHFAEIAAQENILVLAATPGDETRVFGDLIKETCRQGRPAYVIVLTDGTTLPCDLPTQDQRAALQEKQTRTAIAALGLPANRLLMAGVYDTTLPANGPFFNAVVNTITTVMWARDCNVIATAANPQPTPDQQTTDQQTTYRIASAVAAQSGVAFLPV